VLDARIALVRAFIPATWLLDSWGLLPEVMDVRLEFADFPFLTGKALADRMQGVEISITNEDKVNAEALDGNSNLKLIGTPSVGIDHICTPERRKHTATAWFRKT
jgi:lactate dehydrogenase-like 2-hydroxyacid dehydrogenase